MFNRFDSFFFLFFFLFFFAHFSIAYLLKAHLQVRHIRSEFFGYFVALMIESQPAVHEAQQLFDRRKSKSIKLFIPFYKKQGIIMRRKRQDEGVPFRQTQTFCVRGLLASGRRTRDWPGKSGAVPSPKSHPPKEIRYQHFSNSRREHVIIDAKREEEEEEGNK